MGGNTILGVTSSIKAPVYDKSFSADGTVRMKAVAHAALTAKTPYKIIVNEYGCVTAALADDTNYYYVGVPETDVDSGALCDLVIGGPMSDMITPSLSMSVGHALVVLNGAVADAGADYSGAAGQFAVATAASTTSTTQDVILVPERIIGTT